MKWKAFVTAKRTFDLAFAQAWSACIQHKAYPTPENRAALGAAQAKEDTAFREMVAAYEAARAPKPKENQQ